MSKLAHSNQETMDEIERRAHEDEANGVPDEPRDGVFFHATPDPDACKHDFQGNRDLLNEEGQVCGGTTVCTKCGMDAMTYTLRTGF